MTFLIVLGAIWAFSGGGNQIEFTKEALLPNFTSSENWISLIAIMASFLGMELAGVHVSDIDNPARNFPKRSAGRC